MHPGPSGYLRKGKQNQSHVAVHIVNMHMLTRDNGPGGVADHLAFFKNVCITGDGTG